MDPGEKVQVEPRDSHDEVVVVLLERDEDVGSLVPEEDESAIV